MSPKMIFYVSSRGEKKTVHQRKEGKASQQFMHKLL